MWEIRKVKCFAKANSWAGLGNNSNNNKERPHLDTTEKMEGRAVWRWPWLTVSTFLYHQRLEDDQE